MSQRHLAFVIAVMAFLLASMPGIANAAGPQATPLPNPQSTPVPPPVQPGGGSKGVTGPSGMPQAAGSLPQAPSCGNAQPGRLLVGPNATMNAVVVFAEASESSDLYLEHSDDGFNLPPSLVLQGATYNFTPKSFTVTPLLQNLTMSIHTPTFGTVRTSDGQFAKVVQETRGVYLICFEDGGDGDYNDLIVRVWDSGCDGELLLDSGQDPVHVQYDPRYLTSPADPSYLTKAAWMAEGIRDRAIAARNEMANLYSAFGAGTEANGYNVSIQVQCQPRLFGLVPVFRPGITESANLVKLNAGNVQQYMQHYVQVRTDNSHLPPDQRSPVPTAGEPWADLVDHELYHTYQYTKNGNAFLVISNNQFRYQVLGDYVNLESSAQLGEDLLADTDDTIGTSGQPDRAEGSYRLVTDGGLADPPGTSILIDDNDGLSYRAGGFLQYLGERFGSQPGSLETRVAAFARAVYGSDKQRIAALAQAAGRSEAEIVDALRDYWLTELVAGSGNVAALPNDLRLLDESTAHGAAANFAGPVASQRYGPITPDARALNNPSPLVLNKTTAAVWRYAIPANTSLVRIRIADHSAVVVGGGRGVQPRPNDPIRYAIVPRVAPAGTNVVFDRTNLGSGPPRTKEQVAFVAGAGVSSVDLILVAGTTRVTADVTVDTFSGPLALDVDAFPNSIRPGDSLTIKARPTVGDVFARQQPSTSYTVKVDGQTWPIGAAFDQGSKEVLLVPAATTLSPGSHDVAVTYTLGASSVTTHRSIDVAQPFQALSGSGPTIPSATAGGSLRAGDPLEISAIVADNATPVVGATVTATVTDPVGTQRTLTLTDHGSPLDSAAADGAYGAEALGTSAAGHYDISIMATGSSGGVPFSTSTLLGVDLGPIIDGDGDGVSDAMEVRLGLNPANAADGAQDLDTDGLGTSNELQRGTDPLAADTDGAGEADGSEVAAGSNPLSPGDDAVLDTVQSSVAALDGRRVEVTVAFPSGSGTARVFRIAGGSSTDLGLRTNNGSFIDGPLAAGTYEYRVRTEAAGRIGLTTSAGTVDARDDATPPTAALQLDGGADTTGDRNVPLRFTAVTDAPTQMRIAETLTQLESAAWVAYNAAPTFQIANTDGLHAIYAQLRDAAANASGVMSTSITLDLTAPTSTAGPMPISTTSAGQFIPFVASDDRDLAFVEIWFRYRPTQSAAWGAWGRKTMGEASPIFLTLGNGNGFYQIATVSVDRAGNREALPSVGDVEIRLGPEVVNDDTTTTTQSFVQTAAGSGDTTRAIWVDNRNSPTVSDIYTAFRTPASESWSVNERVDDTTAPATSPSLAIDSAGAVYATWVDTRRGDKDIYFSKRNPTTGLWSASVRVNDDAAGAVQDTPTIAVGPTGEAIAVWADGRGNKQHIYASRLPAGGTTWSANLRVTSDQTKVKALPSVAIGTDGVAYVVYQQLASNKYGVWFSSLPSGGTTWSSPVQINDSTRNQGNAKIAVGASNGLLVVYLEGSSTIWSRWRPGGSGTWGTATVVSAATSSALSPSLAMRTTGVGYVTWTTTAGVAWGARFNPATSTWGSASQITSTGVVTRPAVSLTSSTAVVTTELGTGTQTDIRAYVSAVP